MWTLSGFVDEISSDFTEQCRVASRLGLTHVELRSAWDVNILDLKPEQLTVMKDTLAEHDLQVSSIGSPIGKIGIREDFEPHLKRMRHAAEVASQLGAPYVRIFSFFTPEGEDPDIHRDEVLRRMRALADVASSPWSRTWPTATPVVASPEPSSGPAPGRRSPTSSRPKGSSSHD